MAVPVLMPKQGNSVESCVILEWVKKTGDSIAQGEVLCEAETDKATIEIESPAGGTLLKTFFEVDDDVPVQKLIAVIGEPGEDISEFDSGASENSSADEISEETSPADDSTTQISPVSDQGPATLSGGTVGRAGGPVSPRARNTAAAKGVDTSGLAGTGPGGRVMERDVLAAAASGPPLTPAARDAAAAGMSVPASGTGLGGRVRLGDLGPAGSAPAAGEIVISTGAEFPGPFTEIPVKSIRKLVAGRMLDSLASAAQLTNNAAADVSTILAYRKKCKEAPEELGVNDISLNDIFLYLVSRIIKNHPVLNSHWLGDKYLTFERVHLGFAVDTPRGLMVPVIRNADLLSLKAISSEAKRLANACREGKVQPNELKGATFTISNLGSMGIESFTPIINTPEVGILGICSSVLRPVQSGTDVVFKPYSGLSLTYDHQLVDGAPASRFLMDLKTAIENFDLYLAG